MMKIQLLLLVSFTLVSCHFTRKNDPEDIKEAQTAIDKFYGYVKDSNYVEATNMFSEKAFKIRPEDSTIIYFQQIRLCLGKIETYKYSKGFSFVKTGARSSNSQYQLEYLVVYEKDIATEKFLLIKEKDVIKILGYKSISDTLEIKMRELN